MKQNDNDENTIMRKQYIIYRIILYHIGTEQKDNNENATRKIVYNMNSSEFVNSIIIQYKRE